jgi:hypothetical protein
VTTYTLSRGNHRPDSGRFCAMELLALATGQVFNDHPRGVDNVLRNVVVCMNDAALTDDARTRLLLPFVLADPEDLTQGPGRLYGTDDGRTRERMRVVFGLRPVELIRGYIWGLARQSDDEAAALAARRLLDRLIDPRPAVQLPGNRPVPVDRRALVPV